ncbi:MAG: hypothetical protein KDK70_00190 [Myxococcales bacterium]|nr:hypothetical protein [Myxococcales bacterium]
MFIHRIWIVVLGLGLAACDVVDTELDNSSQGDALDDELDPELDEDLDPEAEAPPSKAWVVLLPQGPCGAGPDEAPACGEDDYYGCTGEDSNLSASYCSVYDCRGGELLHCIGTVNKYGCSYSGYVKDCEQL